MRIKKFLAGIGALCLCSALLLPIQAQAAEQSNGTTTLTTTVPDTHSVQLVIGEHGSVKVNDEEYRGTVTVEVPRQAEQTYLIAPESGWQIDTVTYGIAGSEETVSLKDSAYTAPAVYQDGNVLTVTFEKSAAGSGGTSGSGNQTGDSGNKQSGAGSVQTGDNTHLEVFSALLILSGVMTAILLKLRKKSI